MKFVIASKLIHGRLRCQQTSLHVVLFKSALPQKLLYLKGRIPFSSSKNYCECRRLRGTFVTKKEASHETNYYNLPSFDTFLTWKQCFLAQPCQETVMFFVHKWQFLYDAQKK